MEERKESNLSQTSTRRSVLVIFDYENIKYSISNNFNTDNNFFYKIDDLQRFILNILSRFNFGKYDEYEKEVNIFVQYKPEKEREKLRDKTARYNFELKLSSWEDQGFNILKYSQENKLHVLYKEIFQKISHAEDCGVTDVVIFSGDGKYLEAIRRKQESESQVKFFVASTKSALNSDFLQYAEDCIYIEPDFPGLTRVPYSGSKYVHENEKRERIPLAKLTFQQEEAA